MRRLLAKFMLLGLGAAAVLATANSASHAGGLWHSFFGYHDYADCCGSGYGYPGYTSYYGYGSYYGPAVDYGYYGYGFYGPAVDYAYYAPDAYASPGCCAAPVSGIYDQCCGVSGGASECPLGTPGWKSPGQAPAAPGGGGAPRTFEEEKPSDTEKLPPSQEGFGPREPGAPAETPDDAFKTETFKVPTPQTPNSEVPQKQPAPTPPAVDEGTKAIDTDAEGANDESAAPAESATPAEPAAPETEAESAPREPLDVPALNLDQEVTFRAVPHHKRMAIRANFSSPVIVRNFTVPNREWVTVKQATKLVRK